MTAAAVPALVLIHSHFPPSFACQVKHLGLVAQARAADSLARVKNPVCGHRGLRLSSPRLTCSLVFFVFGRCLCGQQDVKLDAGLSSLCSLWRAACQAVQRELTRAFAGKRAKDAADEDWGDVPPYHLDIAWLVRSCVFCQSHPPVPRARSRRS